jgi:hypothetical protein
MREEKIAYKHKKMKLMNNTTFFMSLLIVATLICSSAIPAINLPSKTTKMNENIQREITNTPNAGLAPINGGTALSIAKNAQGMDSQSNSNKMASPFGSIMYGYVASGSIGTGPCYFDVDDPSTITKLSDEQVPGFASGGAWTCDEKWLATDYYNGALWEIDPETGAVTEIGGGGTGMNGLALDPTSNQLYGASGNGATGGLWKVDSDTGEQEYIGDFVSTAWIIGMTCTQDGTLYGWDISPDYLYTIDKDTGEATQVGPLGINLNYAQDGDYDPETETLYLAAFTLSPGYGSFLYTCDLETAECTLVGTLGDGYTEIDGTMFMFNCIPPEHDVGVKSIDVPQDGYALPIINPVVTVKNYGNNSEYTDVQFEIIKCEAGPTLMTEDFTTWPPAGWEYNGYVQSYTNKAGGISPEAYYGYTSYVPYGYIMTPPINATGFEKINVLFRMFADFAGYSGTYFYLQYRKNASSPWRDASPWDNPVGGDLGPAYYQIGCYGWGENIGEQFQARWYFGSYYYYLQYGSGIYIDDITVQGCAGCAEYADIAEDQFVPIGEQISVTFGDWTPSEWHNESSQNTWEDYPMTSYTLLEDQNVKNNKKQRLLHLFYPWLHDVGTMSLSGPESGPAQTFPMEMTIKNVGQYDECCFKTYVQVAQLDMENSFNLLTQNFDSCYPWPPTGWTTTHPSNWQCWYSNYAGGNYPECVFVYYPSQTAISRFKTQPIDTSAYGAVKIDFKHYVNHFSGPYTLKVETSPDGISWSTVWEIVNPSSGGGDVSIVTGANVGSDNFYVSWTFDGNFYNINYWFIDNIVINGYPLAEPEYTDSYCIETLAVGQEKLVQFDDWTPAFLAEDTTGQIIYAIKVWTDLLSPEDNNHANDAIATSVTLDFFHDIGIEVAAPVERGIKMLWDNGDTDGTNGYSLLGNPQRRLLDDFELSQSAKISQSQVLMVAGSPTDMEVRFRVDDNKKPSTTIYATSKDIKTTSKATGRTWFGYPEYRVTYDFQPIKLTKGIWWAEFWTSSSAGNMYMMIRAKLWREECWINYADYGFMKASSIFGSKADLSFQLYGQAGAEVYVPPSDQDIDALGLNVGTFPEKAMTSNAAIYEFYTDCENGTLVYEDTLTDIQILTPLTGTKLLNFKNYEFTVEGLYRLDFEIIHGDASEELSYDNNRVEYMIGCDATPPATTYALSPAIPDGLNGWYISDVEVTLKAADPTIGCDSDGSGVQEIKYQVDGGAVQTLPGETGVFTVTTDSTMHTIKYWSIDNVGNAESQKTIQFKQDQTVPEIDFTYEWSGDKAPYTFTFNATATDATSGMQRVEIYLNAELQETIIGSGPYYIWEILWVPVPKAIFRAIAFDFAGLSQYDDIIDPKLSKNSVSQSISSQNSMRLPLSK